MPDDLISQAANSVPAAGVGGGFVGVVLTIITGLKLFARPQDIDLAKAELRAEIAEKYAHKDELTKMGDDLAYIRQRIDQFVDRKPNGV